MKNIMKYLLVGILLTNRYVYTAEQSKAVEVGKPAESDKEFVINLLKIRLKQLMRPLFIVLHGEATYDATYGQSGRSKLRDMIEKTIADYGQGSIKVGDPIAKIDRVLGGIKKPMVENEFVQVLRLVEQGKLLDARALVRSTKASRRTSADFTIEDFEKTYSDILARIMYEGLMGTGRPYAFLFAPVKRSGPVRPEREERGPQGVRAEK